MGYLKKIVRVGIYFDLLAGRKETALNHCIRFLISCGFCRGSVSSLEHGGFLSLHNLDFFFFLIDWLFFLLCVQILFAPMLLYWGYYAEGMQASRVTMVHFPLMTLSTGRRHFCGVMNSLGLPLCFLHMLWKLSLSPRIVAIHSSKSFITLYSLYLNDTPVVLTSWDVWCKLYAM